MADDQDSESEPQGRVPGRSDPPRPPRLTRREADEDPPALSQTVSGDITPRQLRVTPGQTAIATVKIRYHGSVVTELGLTLSGEAAAWTRVVPDVINVLPDTDAEATLQFDPPRASNPKAGLVDLVLNVSARGNESDRTQLRRPIIVDPFDDLGAEAGDST